MLQRNTSLPVAAWVYKLVSGLLIFSLIVKLGIETYRLPWHDYNSYGLSEFLVNFQGGFVRRGLLGELLYRLCSVLHVPPTYIIIPACYLAYFACLGIFLRLFRKRELNWWLILSPFMCGITIYIVRKDYMLILMLLAMYGLIARHGSKNAVTLAGVITLSCLGLFLHEAFIFWGLPIVFLLLLSQSKRAGIAYGAIICATFLVLAYFKGDSAVALRIHQSWRALCPHELTDTIPATINSLGWSTGETAMSHFTLNFLDKIGPVPVWCLRPIVLLCSYYLVTNIFYVFRRSASSFTDTDRTNLSALYLFSLVMLLPMFLFLSCDYGRLYQYATISALGTFVIFKPARLSRLFPRGVYSLTAKINRQMDRICRPNPWVVIIILLLIAACPTKCYIKGVIANGVLTSIPYYCLGALRQLLH